MCFVVASSTGFAIECRLLFLPATDLRVARWWLCGDCFDGCGVSPPSCAQYVHVNFARIWHQVSECARPGCLASARSIFISVLLCYMISRAWYLSPYKLCRYQDPTEADKLAKIQKDLDETKVSIKLLRCTSLIRISFWPASFYEYPPKFATSALSHCWLQVILHKTIDEILVRGERLDDLVDRTADLSAQSKQFYKVAQKHNSCCSLMWRSSRKCACIFWKWSERKSRERSCRKI